VKQRKQIRFRTSTDCSLFHALEFRALREKHEFFECCRNPELACEITMQPIRKYAGLLDAAIIFPDILVIPQAMGLEVTMLPTKGLHFPDPLNNPSDLKRLHSKVDVTKELGYVYEAKVEEAVHLKRQRLGYSSIASKVKSCWRGSQIFALCIW
jgi:uroporphyrinogen-III decarboxylase